MEKRGIIIAFSGALGLGTGALSTVVAELLEWPRVRFSDFIRREAERLGEDPNERAVLQRIGQELVSTRREYFVSSVLAMARWHIGENLILDGLRHAEVHDELVRQVGRTTDVHVVHIEMDDETRKDRAKRSDGFQDADFQRYDKDVTEAQMERVPPVFAELTLDGAEPRGELARRIVDLFAEMPAQAILDAGEAVSRMEPLLISADSGHRVRLAEMANQVVRESQDFAAEVPIGLRRPLADLVRAMNCYYSNRIEGNSAAPSDIELALRSDYSSDPHKRYLQAEARAHIAVQEWIDGGGLAGQPIVSRGALRKIHDRFYSELPEALLWVEDPRTKERVHVLPGEYRRRAVQVGRHVAPSPGSIARFLHRFETIYKRTEKPADDLLAAATAHHRLLWIHPFVDGNGRVARLMSHAMLCDILNTHSIWSVARGFALADDQYKNHLAACDLGRRNDLDGRGPLSEETLAEFALFFLSTCLEQVRFMRDRMQLVSLQTRLEEWVRAAAAFERLPQAASRLLIEATSVGALGRNTARNILGGRESEADRVIDQLIREGILRSKGDALTFAFPTKLAERLLPGLFP